MEGLQETFCIILTKILTPTNSSQDLKLKNYNKFKELYNLRSEIVHTGSEYIYPGFIPTAKYVALQLIFHMLNSHKIIKSDEDLHSYLKDLKLK